MCFLRRSSIAIALIFLSYISVYPLHISSVRFNSYEAILSEINNKVTLEANDNNWLINRAIIHHLKGVAEPSLDIWSVYDTSTYEIEGLAEFAYYLARKKMPEAALPYFNMYLKKSTKNVAAYMGKGGVLIALERYKEAVEILEKGLKLAPENTQYWHLLLEAYFYAGKDEKMAFYIEEFEKWIRSDGTIVRSSSAWTRYPFAYEGAILKLYSQLEPKTNSIAYFEQLSLLYEELGLKEAACQAANKAYAGGLSYTLRAFNTICNPLLLQEGNTLTYSINYYGQKSELKFSLKTFSANEILAEVFTASSSEVRSLKHLTAYALTKAKELSFIFNQDESVLQAKMAWMWLPTESFNNLREGKKATYTIDGRREVFSVEASGLHYIQKGSSERSVAILHLVSPSGKFIDVLNDPTNPLIVKSNFGRKMSLKSVN